MIDVACPECLLTPSGGRLLTSVYDGLESTRPDDPTWQVERCSSCGQPRSIHDDLDGSTFGDLTAEHPPDTRPILDSAPEWITFSEAAYGARVPEALILEWTQTGHVERVALFPGKGPHGVLVRTADVRASIASGDRAPGPSRMPTPVEATSEADPDRPGSGLSLGRRKVLVGLGMAAALIPARAIAGGGPRLAPGTTVLDPLVMAVKPLGTTDSKSGTGKPPGGGSGGHGGHGGGSGGGGGAGGTTAIQSVTVRPDPVVANGTATITIDASPRQRIVSYGMTASEGTLVQDPQSPWIWTWRAA